MSEPKTVRDVLAEQMGVGAADVCDMDAEDLGEALHFRKDILDAHVIRTCPTCGGSRLIPVPAERGFGLDAQQAPCPDCADAPVWVIAPEAWERAARLLFRQRFPGHTWGGKETLFLVAAKAIVLKNLDELAQALLPGARRAKEVGAAHGVLWANTSDVEELPYPSLVAVIADDGPRAAIHNEQEKE